MTTIRSDGGGEGHPDSLKLRALRTAASRAELWSTFITAQAIEHMAEVGVFRGAFADEDLSCTGRDAAVGRSVAETSEHQ